MRHPAFRSFRSFSVSSSFRVPAGRSSTLQGENVVYSVAWKVDWVDASVAPQDLTGHEKFTRFPSFSSSSSDRNGLK
jgi:hypothetical protein